MVAVTLYVSPTVTCVLSTVHVRFGVGNVGTDDDLGAAATVKLADSIWGTGLPLRGS